MKLFDRDTFESWRGIIAGGIIIFVVFPIIIGLSIWLSVQFFSGSLIATICFVGGFYFLLHRFVFPRVFD